MRRFLFGAALLSLLSAMPLASCGKREQPTQAEKAQAGPRITLSPTSTIDWQEVSAEIATKDQAQVLARIAGILSTLSVQEGDMVRKGQTIGRVVNSQLGFQAGAHGAEAAAAQSRAVQAQSELARVRFLYDNGVYAVARLEQARAEASAAQAQVRAAQAQRASIEAIAEQGLVVAPAAGRVLRTDIPVGAPVAPGTPIAVVTAGPTVVRMEIPESMARKVRVGSRVIVSEPEHDRRTGQVVKLYPAVASGQVMVDADMPGIDGTLIGRRLAAKVETGARKALLVPQDYVTNRFGIDYVALLARDGSAAQVPVQTMPSSEAGKIEILSGVVAGDVLVGPARGERAK